MPGGSLYDSHGDVLVTKVHKPNSLEHLKSDRFGRRPTSAASSRSYTSKSNAPSRPQSAMSRPRTASASSLASTSAYTEKTVMRKIIDGDTGPQMVGVTTYPYTRLQHEYLDDFQSLVATTIDHPYMATAAFNRSSVPHDLLYGSNFDDDRLGAEKKWKSEYRRTYLTKDMIAAKRAASSGVRSEQFQFLG